MGRFPQDRATRGSQKWTQLLANMCPWVIESQIREFAKLSASTRIEWVSPLSRDDYAEYRDNDFLQRVGIRLSGRDLKTFWPRLGPQWDALARADTGQVFLFESKSHVEELLSAGTKASGKSRDLIESSVREAQVFFGCKNPVDWAGPLYQSANRLAHLYFLRQLNAVPAFLVNVYFLNDKDMDGPGNREVWDSAIKLARGVLGLREGFPLSQYVVESFVDIVQLPTEPIG